MFKLIVILLLLVIVATLGQSMFFMVKDQGRWRIAAHAWDHATEQNPVPEDLRSRFLSMHAKRGETLN